MADNMGGISDAWFAFSRQIASVSQEADKVKVGLKSGDWINLHPGDMEPLSRLSHKKVNQVLYIMYLVPCKYPVNI